MRRDLFISTWQQLALIMEFPSKTLNSSCFQLTCRLRHSVTVTLFPLFKSVVCSFFWVYTLVAYIANTMNPTPIHEHSAFQLFIFHIYIIIVISFIVIIWNAAHPEKVKSMSACRDQARGRLGRNSRPRGRNFALNGTQGEVGVSLKKKKIFFFFETHFHSVTTQMQAVVTLSDNLLPLHRVSFSIKWQ